uniref:Uncharacterized protein n=1 Tax=Oryzias latipes TaxID=8090 RepID=A0A3B3HV84_ORYLA
QLVDRLPVLGQSDLLGLLQPPAHVFDLAFQTFLGPLQKERLRLQLLVLLLQSLEVHLQLPPP